MTPMSPDFPESFSAVLARLGRALALLRQQPGTVSDDVVSAPEVQGLAFAALLEQLPACAQALRACGQAALASVVEGCAAAVRRGQTVPALQGSDAQGAVERALAAVLERAEHPSGDAVALAVELFPLHRAVQHLAGADRVHPADLWPGCPVWVELAADPFTTPRGVDAGARGALEAALLALMRQPRADDFQRMGDLCAALGEGALAPQASLWKLASAVYEAQAGQQLSPDVYLKRLGPRLLALTRVAGPGAAPSAATSVPPSSSTGLQEVLLGYAVLPEPIRLLAHELLFFCHRAAGAVAADPALALGPRLQRFALAYGVPSRGQTAGAADAEDLQAVEEVVPAAQDAAYQTPEGPQTQQDEPAADPEQVPPARLEEGPPPPAAAQPEPAHPPTPAAPPPQRALTDAVPGLPSAADLDLSSWGLAANADQAAPPDDEVKVIGPLRLEIPVFNAFLNDADEASRRLSMLLGEWAVEPAQPVPGEAAQQAQALAQGAQGVGHGALAALADLLVRVLQAWAPGAGFAALAPGSPALAPAGLPADAPERLTAAAEEVRRVLHQFAAGFLTEPLPDLVNRLVACLPTLAMPSALAPGLAAPMSSLTLTAEAAVSLSPLGPGEVGSLHEIAGLQSAVAQALARLAHCRPSLARTATDLDAAEQAFEAAWADASAGLAACERLLAAVLSARAHPEA